MLLQTYELQTEPVNISPQSLKDRTLWLTRDTAVAARSASPSLPSPSSSPTLTIGVRLFYYLHMMVSIHANNFAHFT